MAELEQILFIHTMLISLITLFYGDYLYWILYSVLQRVKNFFTIELYSLRVMCLKVLIVIVEFLKVYKYVYYTFIYT